MSARLLRSSTTAVVAGIALVTGGVAIAAPRDAAPAHAPSDSGGCGEPAPSSPEPAPAPGAPGEVAVGVPDGVSLSTYTGSRTLREDGQVLENVVVPSDLVVTGHGVTLRNVRVEGNLIFRRTADVRLETSEVASLSISGSEGVVVTGVEVFGLRGVDGVHITSGRAPTRDVTLSDVWVHSPQVSGRSHYDGIQVRGVDGLTLERVRVELGEWQRQFAAALFLEDANGGNRDVTVVDSRFEGGGYTLYAFADDVTIEGTVFDGGRWGHLFPRSWTSEITVFEGNTDADGNPLQLRSTSIG